MPDWIISLFSAAVGTVIGFLLSVHLEKRRVASSKSALYLDVEELKGAVHNMLLKYESIHNKLFVDSVPTRLDFHDWMFKSLVQDCASLMTNDERKMMKKISSFTDGINLQLEQVGIQFRACAARNPFGVSHKDTIKSVVHSCAKLYYLLNLLSEQKERFRFPSERDEAFFVKKGLEWSHLPQDKIRKIL